MKSTRLVFVAALLLRHLAAGLAWAQTPARVRSGPPIDSVRVTFGSPEKTIRVEGYVLDRVTRQPVPKVSVWRKENSPQQARTDANGHFVLYLPARTYRKGQLLTVQTRYYKGSTAVQADATQPVMLLLKQHAHRLNPHTRQQLDDTIRISADVPPVPILGSPGSQFAFLIRYSLLREPHKLRAITLRIGGRDVLPHEPTRLRIYQYSNDPEAPPGNELLLETFNICPAMGGIYL